MFVRRGEVIHSQSWWSLVTTALLGIHSVCCMGYCQ